MREYIDQIFYEGLGKSIYCPVERVIKKIKNKNIEKYLTLLCKVVYFIISILIAFVLLYIKL